MARILVVDDEADMRMALSNVLNRMGHQVFEAENGPDALDFHAREKADLILLDIRLPGMDGVQILRKLRESDRTTPVIMVTGYGSVESAVEVMQLGASHYLAKPFSNHELRETVERVLSGKMVEPPAGILSKRLADKVRVPAARPESAPPAVIERAMALVPASVISGDPASWFVPAAVMALMVLLMVFWSIFAGGGGRSLNLSHENPTALVWHGDRLWTADWLTQTLYENKLEGGRLEVVRSYPLPQTHITGLAVTDQHVYVCDSWKKVIQQRRLDDNLTLVQTYNSPGPSPSGLFWDGRYLWSSDSANKRFYQHETEANLSVLASYRAPGNAPTAVFKDDSYFWSADSEARMIYQHRLDEKLRVLSAYSLEQLDEGPTPLSSFTWKDNELWLARDGSQSLQIRPLDSFTKIEKGVSLK
ncbi:MAG: response regulator [Elusimicrobiota bacterium]